MANQQLIPERLSDKSCVARLKRAFSHARKCAIANRYQIAVEVFSGCGGLSASLRKLGHGVLSFDIKLGAQYDCTCPVVLKVVMGWISSHCISAVWLGTPCNGWTQA